MRWLRSFGLFWWDFIVGDDPLIAVGVVMALGATAGLVAADLPAWWLVPVCALAVLGGSVWRKAARSVASGG